MHILHSLVIENGKKIVTELYTVDNMDTTIELKHLTTHKERRLKRNSYVSFSSELEEANIARYSERGRTRGR